MIRANVLGCVNLADICLTKVRCTVLLDRTAQCPVNCIACKADLILSVTLKRRWLAPPGCNRFSHVPRPCHETFLKRHGWKRLVGYPTCFAAAQGLHMMHCFVYEG